MSADHDELKQHPDSIESGKIIVVGVSALVIFALGIVWAVFIQRDSIAKLEGTATGTIYSPSQVPSGDRDEVGMVFQQTFDREYGQTVLMEAQERLDSVGWVDQKTKKVHIPIERAIKDYLAAEEKNGGKL
jgi:hypothetical protein